MSAEVASPPTAAEPKPDGGEAPAATGTVDATPSESTSKANEAAAEAQPAPTVEANGEKPSGEDAITTAETTTAEPSGATVVAPDSSAKNEKDGKKRRSSAGVPEHKAKKGNAKKKGPELQLDAEPGDLFIANMKGFPKWPAIICDEEMLPEALLANRPVTARRPDGSYRDDFLPGGKNVRDRTYPIMFLGTYEFSWMTNTCLQPLTPEQAGEQKTEKLTKGLQIAFSDAKEGYKIDHYKSQLIEFQRANEEYAAEQAAAKKAKTPKKSKKKSDDTVDDEDEEMADADALKSSKSTSKKRKAETDGEDDGGKKKMKLNLNKSTNTPKAANGEKAKASKAKTPKSDKKSAKKEEPQMSDKEKHDRRKQATLYCRHKLQKAFLTTDVSPKDEDMDQMASYFLQLEKTEDIDAAILRDTKIHKVMKGIVKLGSIPRDNDFHFKDRAQALLDGWNKLLGESGDKPRPSTANEEKKEAAPTAESAKAEEKKDDTIDEDKKVEDEKKEEATEPVEKTEPGNDAQDEAMPDAGAEKDIKPVDPEAPTEDGIKDASAPAVDGEDAAKAE